ncbi:CHY_zinc finger domain-containing protein [Hexamita inflata]|uniref:CHY zinc finger domain-containing protein n=1 Tax=Hexamita inflata TaxID=28002 RepID=A0AA86NVJ2_9EUKA|nr:CHY zinc finger domain-containing protein [Hexamita inflata]CAI9966708.1 CHY zinc finger domain-containing protein [Hexamita inflata]
MKCYELKVELFVLIDPLKSYSTENRKVLRTVSFSTIDEEEKEGYERGLQNIEPLFPYSWYNENQSYWEMKYSHNEEYKQLVDASDQFVRFMKSAHFDPLQTQASKNKDIKQKRKDDPDYEYLQYTNPKIHLSYEERHQLELQDPLIYGQYSINTTFGCKHGLRGAYIYCEVCDQFYGCEICHNEEADHQIQFKNVNKVKCCNCEQVQDISDHCAFCSTQFSNCFCNKCKTIQILDKETEPYYHCDFHDECHLFSMKAFSTICQKCNKCVPITQQDEHECDEITCLICQGIISTNFDYITLPCNSRHKMHEVCYQNYLRSQTKGNCPLCRRSILETSAKRFMQTEIVNSLKKQNGILFPYNEIRLVKFRCRDCLKVQMDCDLLICRNCWFDNVDKLEEKVVLKKQLIEFLDGKEGEFEQSKEMVEMREEMTVKFKEVFENIIKSMKDDNAALRYIAQHREELRGIHMDVGEEEEMEEEMLEMLEEFEEEEFDELF